MRLVLAILLIIMLFSALSNCMYHPYGYYGGGVYGHHSFWWPHYHYHPYCRPCYHPYYGPHYYHR